MSERKKPAARKAPVDPINYKQYPALAAYIDRIGAEQKNARRYLMVEHFAHGYYHEKGSISLDKDGGIKVSHKEYAPTKEEAEAIKELVLSIQDKWPRSIHATEAKIAELRKAFDLGPKANLFMFYSRSRRARDGNITMVQQRIQKDDGTKYFVNYSFFSDGIWRSMEPDQGLPFWKPPVPDGHKRGNERIMIHEGGKTAKFLTELKEDKVRLAKHPWREIIEAYEHWGMIGGALVPHRTEYKELHDEMPAEVVYVCDNDFPGKSALQKVSKSYGKALLGVMFDKRFKDKWDMGDELEPHFFAEGGKYIGPPFEEFLTFATHATRLKPPAEGKAGRPIVELTDAFKEEWYHCVTPEVFVHHRWPSMILTTPEFNNHVAPFSDADDTARLLKKDRASKSAVLAYEPGKPSGIYATVEGMFINTHIPTSYAPKQGDVEPFLAFLRHLVPGDTDRMEVERWCATLIACPDIKMLYGVLLISEAQGIGKGTLGERILAPLVGASNVSYPSESEITDSNYNYWAAHKRLAVVHEIYAGHSAKAYNKLKSIVTDRYITVQKKYQANYQIENWIHILACSNSPRAIQLSMDDRRWFVPKLTEEKKSTAYWSELNKWLTEGGLNIIHQWALDWVKKNPPVMKGQDAPMSVAKKEIVEEGYSPGMNVAAAALDFLKHKLTSEEKDCVGFREKLAKANMYKDGSALVVDTDLVKFISSSLYESRHNDRLERPLTIRKVAKAKGWHVNGERITHYRWGKDRYKGHAICLLAPDARRSAMDLVESGLKPIDLSLIEGM